LLTLTPVALALALALAQPNLVCTKDWVAAASKGGHFISFFSYTLVIAA
jgi:hypothetical protein